MPEEGTVKRVQHQSISWSVQNQAGDNFSPLLLQKPVRFSPPEEVTITGSHAVQCVAQPGKVVDVSVKMPKSCFDQKDQLDDRYMHRRAVFLAVLGSALLQQAKYSKQHWLYLRDNIR